MFEFIIFIFYFLICRNSVEIKKPVLVIKKLLNKLKTVKKPYSLYRKALIKKQQKIHSHNTFPPHIIYPLGFYYISQYFIVTWKKNWENALHNVS